MVEAFEIEVPFVRTHENIADFLTKPFSSAPKFFEMRAIIMNEPERGAGGVRGRSSRGTPERGGASETGRDASSVEGVS